MRKVMGKVKRTLSVILAVAMVVTMVPQTGMAVYAQEDSLSIETEEPEVDVLTPEVSPEDPEDAEDALVEDTEGESVDEEVDDTTETPEAEEPADEGTPEVEDPTEETPEAEEPADEETPEVTEGDKSVMDNEVMADAEQFDVTVGAEKPSNTDTVDGTGYTVKLPDSTGKVTEGTPYKFTVTAKSHYKITAVKYSVGGSETPFENVNPAGGEFTIPGDAITAAVTITVEAAKIQHNVTATYNTTYVDITSDQVSFTESGEPVLTDEEQADGLTFTVKVKTAQTANYSINKVAYQIGSAAAQDVTDADGTYTITIAQDKFIDDVTITVTGTVKHSGITVAYESVLSGSAGQDALQLYSVESDGKGGYKATEAINLSGEEGKDILFTFLPKTGDGNDDYEVRKVTATVDGESKVVPKDTTITKVTVGADTESSKEETVAVYKLTLGEEKPELKATVDYAKTKSNTINVTLNGKPDTTVTVEGSNPTLNETVEGEGGSVSFKNAEVTLTVEADDPTYILNVVIPDVKDVEVKPAEANSTTDNQKVYTITFPTEAEESTPIYGNELNVTVTTSPAPSTKKFEAIFVQGEDVVGYEVTAPVKEAITGRPGAYEIPDGSEYFAFNVTVPEFYDPAVTVKGNTNGENITLGEPVKGETKEGNITYSYQFDANELNSFVSTYITVTLGATVQEDHEFDVTVSYPKGAISTTAVVNGKTDETESGDTSVTYKVPYNKTIEITAKANDNFTISSAITKEKDSEAEGTAETISSDKKSVTIKIENPQKAMVTTIETDSSLALAGLKADPEDSIVSADVAKDTYSVLYNGKYTVGIVDGSEAQPIEKIEVLDESGKALAEEAAKAIKVDGSGDARTITMTKDAAGNTYTVKLYIKGEKAEGATEEPAPVEVEKGYTLKVLALPTGVTVGGGSAISQAVYTTVEYNYSLTPAVDAKVSGLVKAESSAVDVATIQAEDGKLEVTALKTGEATIKFYTENGSEKDYIGEGIKLTVAKLLDEAEGTKPEVSEKTPSDTYLRLKLGTPKAVADKLNQTEDTDLNDKDLYYEVVVTLTDTIESGAADDGVIKTAQTFYVPKTAHVNSQYADFPVFEGKDKGDGCAHNFEVKVTLIQTAANAITSVPAYGTVIYTAQNAVQDSVKEDKSALTTFAAKTYNPSYEYKLKLVQEKKVTSTTVYTTQAEAKVAKVQFSAGTTFTEIKEAEITDTTQTGNSGLSGYIDADGYLIINVPLGATVGKHVLEVKAEGKEDAKDGQTIYVARTKLNVTVKAGIADLSLYAPSAQIVKADAKKKVTMKITPTYSSRKSKNGKAIAVASKKANWEIEVPEGSKVAGMVTVKNGTVTIDKNFVPSDIAEENIFYVKATAADYDGKNNSGTRTARTVAITITKTGSTLDASRLVIVKQEGYGNYSIVARTDGKNAVSLKASDLAGTKLAVLTDKANASLPIISDDDIDGAYYSFKSSNAKALAVTSSNKDSALEGLTALKSAKNISLTVTANDGSKKKAVFKVTIEYATPTLGVELMRANELDYDYDNGSDYYYTSCDKETPKLLSGKPDYSYSGTDNTKFRLRVKQQNGDDWVDVNEFINYSVSIKGGKFGYKTIGSGYRDYVDVIANAADTIVTFKVKNAGGKTDSYTYTLKNTTFPDKKAGKVSVAFKDYAGKNTTLQTQYSSRSIQGVLTLPKNYTLPADKKSYVLVSVDNTALTAQNCKYYSDFAEAGGFSDYDSSWREVRGNTFGLYFEGIDDLKTGTYKLKLTVGYVDDNAKFVPYTDLKTAGANLKVTSAKAKKASFKPTVKYTLSSKNGFKAELTGKGANLYTDYYDNGKGYQFTRLMNTIYAKGENIGQQNLFRDFFELKDGYISLKSVADLEKNPKTQAVVVTNETTGEKYVDLDKLGKDYKNDLTGYVAWKAAGNGLSWNKENETKITITFTKGDKATVNYVLSTASVLKAADGKASANVVLYDKSDKTQKKIDMAAVYTAAEGVTATLLHQDVDGEDGYDYITLSLASPKDGKNSISLYVVPKNSYYAETITKESDAAKKNALIEKYGTPLTATVTVNDPATKSGKISIAKKDKTQTFTRDYFWGDTYYVAVPYTKTVDCNIYSITAVDTEGVNKVFTFDTSVENGQNCIRIGIKRADMKTAVAEGKEANKAKTFSNVQAIVHFDKDDTIKTEPIAFTTLTMPTEISEYDTYDAAVATLKGDGEEAGAGKKAIEALTANYNYYYYEDYGWETDAPRKAADYIRDNYRSDSGFVFDFSKISEDLDEATATENGSVTVSVPIWESKGSVDTSQVETAKETLEFTLTIPKTGNVDPYDVAEWFTEDELKEYVDGSGETKKTSYQTWITTVKPYTNATSEADVLKDARDFVAMVADKKDVDVSNIRVICSDFTLTPATESAESNGGLSAELSIVDITDSDGYSSETVMINQDIDPLQTLSVAKSALETAFVAFGGAGESADSDDPCEVSNHTTQKDVEDLINKTITNTNIKWEWAENTDDVLTNAYKKEAATSSAVGHITGKIKLSNPDSKNDADAAGAEYELNVIIPKYRSADDAIDKVKAELADKAADIAKANGYDATKIKDYILSEANDKILKKDPYVVECSTVEIDPPKLKATTISYTLTLKVVDSTKRTDFTEDVGTAGSTVVGTDGHTNPINATAALEKDGTLEVLTEASSYLDSYFKNGTDAATNSKVDASSKGDTDITNKVQTALTEQGYSAVTVAVKEVNNEKVFSDDQKGTITVTMTLTQTKDSKQDPVDWSGTFTYEASQP